MKHSILSEQLAIEKEKLDRLAGEALRNDVPLSQDQAVMVQNRKVDELVIRLQLRLQHQKNKRRKQPER